MVSVTKFWIEGVLTDVYPQFLENKGIDLDGNGAIEDTIDVNEVFGDLDGNGQVGNHDDYKIYLRKNRFTLSAKIPFLKWGEKLSVNNRIHQLMYWLSDLHSVVLMQSAYLFIANRVEDANRALVPRSLPSEQEAPVYYQVMERAGIIFKNQDDSSLITNIAKHQLDCDTSSFVAMAIADERGVTLQGVLAPSHFFLRGKGEDGSEFNIDQGSFTSNKTYLSPPFSVTEEQIRDKVYLQTLNEQQLENIFLLMRGDVLYKLGRYQEALAVYDRAIEIDKNFASAHCSRGMILEKLGRYQEALAAYDRVIEIDKNEASAHHNRGIILKKLGRYQESLAAYDRVIEIDKNFAIAHYSRGIILYKLGRYQEALAVYDRVIEIDKNKVRAHYNRGVVLKKLGRDKESLDAFKRACEQDPSLLNLALRIRCIRLME